MSCNASWLLGVQLLSRENGQGTWERYIRGRKTRALTPTLSALPDLASDQAIPSWPSNSGSPYLELGVLVNPGGPL